MSRIDKIVNILINFEGITRKYVLPTIIDKLRHASYQGGLPHSLGEDSATIETNSEDYILLTTDSVIPEFCLKYPRAAGFNVVLANIMDIYAAGGVPTSFAVALSYSNPAIGEELLQGIIDGSHMFRVPVIRGHTNPSSSTTYVVGAATGTVAKKDVLTAGGAQEGDILILLFDRAGHRGKYYWLGWDSVSWRDSHTVLTRLSVMNVLAREHLVTAAKDVSTAGIVGTAGMMVEYSGIGAILNLDELDRTRPPRIPLEDWLRMFISLGFLVSVKRKNVSQVFDCAWSHGMFPVSIGTVIKTPVLKLELEGEVRTLFDFQNGPLLAPSEKSIIHTEDS